MSHRTLTVVLALCVSALVGALISRAGPLDPPAGPVASTYKTLTEVEPRIAINATNTPGDADSLYKITQRGSYYLTGNITGVVGKHGIEIAASGVTLDLNGFDLVGVASMGAFDGVSVTVDGLRGISVLNGSARNWGDGGVDLGFLSRGCRVEGVLASGNAGTGIISSIASTVTNCTSVFNGQRGIRASNSSTISNCSVESNTGSGIEVNHGCTISNCSAYFNTAIGILAGLSCTVDNCSAYQNTGNGIQLGESGVVTVCSVQSNTGIGINTGNGCIVSNCAASNNSGDGIRCSSRCTIRGNTCTSNRLSGLTAAIRVFGSQCRIEGNTCTDSDRGINTNFSGNIIIRNTCSGNEINWAITSGNFYGPVVAPPQGEGFLGNTSPGGLGSTDPNANFSY